MGDGLSLSLALEDGTPFGFLTVFEDGKGGYSFDLHDFDKGAGTEEGNNVRPRGMV